MFRTRDFLLLFTTIVFLVMAISATSYFKFSPTNEDFSKVKLAEVSNEEYSVKIDSPEGMSREKNLEEMRKKISASKELAFVTPEVDLNDVEIEMTPSTTTSLEEVVTLESPLLCEGYAEYVGNWPNFGVKTETVEGARIFYLEVVREYEPDPLSTTTADEVPSETSKDILLQLPMLQNSLGQENCLPTDVVGVAKDGSLIRNNEISLYGVFGDDVVIGYALDGLPIFGTSNKTLDNCGGAISELGYGYYLKPEGENVLNCFSSTPKKL